MLAFKLKDMDNQQVWCLFCDYIWGESHLWCGHFKSTLTAERARFTSSKNSFPVFSRFAFASQQLTPDKTCWQQENNYVFISFSWAWYSLLSALQFTDEGCGYLLPWRQRGV